VTTGSVWTKVAAALAAHPFAAVTIIIAIAVIVIARSAADVVIRCNAEQRKNQRYSMALDKVASAEERARIIRALESAPEPEAMPSLRQRLRQFVIRQEKPPSGSV
jgi:hypothetical protein